MNPSSKQYQQATGAEMAIDMRSTQQKYGQPTKESVRHWIGTRAKERKPLPDPDQVRRELGWGLVQGR